MDEKEIVGEIIDSSTAKPDDPGKSIADYKDDKSSDRHYYGDALNDDNVNDIIDEVVPHVVVIVGFPKYGKSTFVASLYHAVLTVGKIGKFRFVDSDTITGFERRSQIRKLEHDTKKRIDRTPVYADYFLSLLFQNEENGQLIKIVLSDRSGEAYRNYVKDENVIEKDKALRYAQHILFFLDSKKIASDGFFDVQTDLRSLTKRMNKYGAFGDGKKIDVVFNKIDQVKDNTDYVNNKAEILSLIKNVTPVNKEFELCSLKVTDNPELNNFFVYLLECCAEPKRNSAEVSAHIDWVNTELSNI